MRTLRLARPMSIVTALLGFVPVAALAADQAKAAASAYVLGPVTKVAVLSGATHAEFRLNRGLGLKRGDRLAVVRPSLGNYLIGEIEATIVDDSQAVGRCPKGRTVKEGDLVVFQRTLSESSGASPSAVAPPPCDLFAEITFWNAPQGETRRTFNARVERIVWEGVVDIKEVELEILLDSLPRARMVVPAASIRQMKVNGMLLVVDGPKKTLVAAAVHDYREVLRADRAERERIAIAKARIDADERSRTAIAKARIDADERHRTALAKAQVESEERIRVATAQAGADADARVKIARIQAEERMKMAELASSERIQTYQRVAEDSTSSNKRLLIKALEATGATAKLFSYFDTKYSEDLKTTSDFIDIGKTFLSLTE